MRHKLRRRGDHENTGIAVLAALFLTLIAATSATPAEGASTPAASWAHDALTQALAASEEITDPFHRAQVLAEISEAYSTTGNAEAARATLQRARAIAEGITGEALRSWALHDIGQAYVKANDLATAEATGESIRDQRLHDVVLAAVADARRGLRDLPGAQATARRIRDSLKQGHALRSIAAQQASENDFTAALVTARSIQHAGVNALAVGDVAALIARAGSFEEARQLVMTIRDAQGRARGLVEVAAAHAGVGDFRTALSTAEQIEDKFARAELLARIGALRPRSPQPSSHELFAQSLAAFSSARGSPGRRCDTLIEIARAQVIAEDVAGSTATLQRAFAELRNVKDDSQRLNMLSRIAPLQARMGDYAGALVTAMRAEDGSLRPLLARDIVVTQAEQGDVDGAVQAARALDDRTSAAAALFGILRVQSQAHDAAGLRDTIGVTLQTVRFIGNAEVRAGALGSLAATRVLEGDISAGRALFSEAMTTAAALDSEQQRAAVYARIADSLADRHRVLSD